LGSATGANSVEQLTTRSAATVSAATAVAATAAVATATAAVTTATTTVLLSSRAAGFALFRGLEAFGFVEFLLFLSEREYFLAGNASNVSYGHLLEPQMIDI
jgi:hypothetical protein